ncbi:MAG TPA: phosphate-binding protein, partial [Chloroflexi bacterium]|nr:phosphate-binding protein [Chloroflexota bacterium]
MRHWIWAVLLATALLVSACGGAATPAAPAESAATAAPAEVAVTEAPTEAPVAEAPVAAPAGAGLLPAVNPLEVTGDIIVAGSSTVYPLTERMAERFRDEGYAGNITIDSIGTGAGFERFCVAGESDISNASRPIKDSERESCRAIGREPVEFRVGTDALAVVVNPANDWIGEEGLTRAELARLFSAEVTNWSD